MGPTQMFRPDFNLLDQLQSILEQTKQRAMAVPADLVSEAEVLPAVPTPTLAPLLAHAEQVASTTEAQLAEVETSLRGLVQRMATLVPSSQ